MSFRKLHQDVDPEYEEVDKKWMARGDKFEKEYLQGKQPYQVTQEEFHAAMDRYDKDSHEESYKSMEVNLPDVTNAIENADEGGAVVKYGEKEYFVIEKEGKRKIKYNVSDSYTNYSGMGMPQYKGTTCNDINCVVEWINGRIRDYADIGTYDPYYESNHIDFVRWALSEGKTVPEEVLKDYPELQEDKKMSFRKLKEDTGTTSLTPSTTKTEYRTDKDVKSKYRNKWDKSKKMKDGSTKRVNIILSDTIKEGCHFDQCSRIIADEVDGWMLVQSHYDDVKTEANYPEANYPEAIDFSMIPHKKIFDNTTEEHKLLSELGEDNDDDWEKYFSDMAANGVGVSYDLVEDVYIITPTIAGVDDDEMYANEDEVEASKKIAQYTDDEVETMNKSISTVKNEDFGIGKVIKQSDNHIVVEFEDSPGKQYSYTLPWDVRSGLIEIVANKKIAQLKQDDRVVYDPAPWDIIEGDKRLTKGMQGTVVECKGFDFGIYNDPAKKFVNVRWDDLNEAVAVDKQSLEKVASIKAAADDDEERRGWEDRRGCIFCKYLNLDGICDHPEGSKTTGEDCPNFESAEKGKSYADYYDLSFDEPYADRFKTESIKTADDDKEPWEMTQDEYREFGSQLYDTLKNEGFVNSDFYRYSSEAPYELHQEAAQAIPDNTSAQNHYIAVKRALSEGKSVPSEVLAEYSDSIKEASIKTAQPTTGPSQNTPGDDLMGGETVTPGETMGEPSPAGAPEGVSDGPEAKPKEPIESKVPTLTIHKKMGPMDIDYLTTLESDRVRHMNSGDLQGLQAVNNKTVELLKKYMEPTPPGDISSEAMIARKEQTHIGPSRNFYQMYQRASLPIEKMQEKFPILVENASLVGHQSDDWSADPDGHVEWALNMVLLGQPKRNSRVGIVKVNVKGGESEMIPILWDSLGCQYGLDKQGFQEFFGVDEL